MAVYNGIVIGDTPQVFRRGEIATSHQPNECNCRLCVCVSFLLCSNEWRAHSKLIGRAQVSPFYWAVVVGSHPDKLKGTDK